MKEFINKLKEQITGIDEMMEVISISQGRARNDVSKLERQANDLKSEISNQQYQQDTLAKEKEDLEKVLNKVLEYQRLEPEESNEEEVEDMGEEEEIAPEDGQGVSGEDSEDVEGEHTEETFPSPEEPVEGSEEKEDDETPISAE